MEQQNEAMRGMGYHRYTATKNSTADADTFWAPHFPDTTRPNLVGKRRVVLVGVQGTGKSTLFNKLTGSSAATSAGIATCTRKNQFAQCLPPFQNVELVDTPGTAIEDVHYDDSYQLREAFIRKPVFQLVLVCGLPSVTRSSEITAVLKPMDNIMKSRTFALDPQGVQVPPKSPYRTRVLLVLTHRDRFTLSKDHWKGYVTHVQKTYDWVGSVVMVDPSVPVENLLGCIILPATCMNGRDYNIPMIEFCSRFPISRHLAEAEELQLQEKLVDFNAGMTLALAKFNGIIKDRCNAGYSASSSYVDKIGPSMDCVMRFLDDLYERKSLEALAILEKVPVDDLWTGTDSDINERRVEKWNAIKSKMGEAYEGNKRLLSQAFPTRPIDAIYKKCNHCGVVYVKPTGCDFGTTCGNSKGGADSLPFTYDYTETAGNRTFEIRENNHMGIFEAFAYKLRKNFATMVMKNPKRFYGGEDSGQVVQEHSFEKGCGGSIKWETMIPLSLEELKHFGLVPEGVEYAVTAPPQAVGKDMPLQTKMREIVAELGLDDGSMAAQAEQGFQQFGIDEVPKTLKDKVDYLYEVVMGK